jgi:hypothetical protein
MRFSLFKQRIRNLLLKQDKLYGKIDTGRRELPKRKGKKRKET